LATRGDASAAGVAFHAEFVDQLRPLRTFAAHCAMARWRLQAGELVFGSLNPFDEKMLDRMLVVRFDPHQFRERMKNNERIMGTLLTYAGTIGRKEGFFSKLMADAKLHGQAGLIDADGEAVSFVGGAAAMIVLTATNYEMSHAVQGTRDSFLFTAAIEVTMPTLVLADLLTSWKNVVEELQ